LCYTYCQVPIIYNLSNEEKVEVVFNDDSIIIFNVLMLDSAISTKMFDRSNEINHIKVSIIK
jgi:hypothetical protein